MRKKKIVLQTRKKSKMVTLPRGITLRLSSKFFVRLTENANKIVMLDNKTEECYNIKAMSLLNLASDPEKRFYVYLDPNLPVNMKKQFKGWRALLSNDSALSELSCRVDHKSKVEYACLCESYRAEPFAAIVQNKFADTYAVSFSLDEVCSEDILNDNRIIKLGTESQTDNYKTLKVGKCNFNFQKW